MELLPEGANPLDVRYNVIQWVHRATRGWSYGTAVVDPRTAEIIKGHVTLGSLRVRQDYLLAEGLLAPYDGTDRSAELEAFALARLRQLSAHEVGHTLGLAHNFAASADGRASVMDYPHPLIRFDAQGGIDLKDAYGTGVGAWDKRTILYGYQDFPAGVDAADARAGILAETLDSGLHFVADAHARDPGSAHPLGSLWDNGADAADELRRLLQVRRAVLNNFSAAVVRRGRPMSRIEDVLVPMYLLHRYQLQAAGKLLGGQTFAYASRGDGQQPITEPVPAAAQCRALEALLDTIQPEALALPPGLVRLIPPRAPGVPVTRELFDRATGDVFDPVAPAEAASRLTLEVLLHPERAARMNRLGATDPEQPGFRIVLDSLLERSWMKSRVREDDAVLQRAINDQVLDGLLDLFRTEGVTPQVRALAVEALLQIAALESTSPLNTPDWRAHFAAARRLVERELDEAWPERRDRVSPPPGSPIGAGRG